MKLSTKPIHWTRTTRRLIISTLMFVCCAAGAAVAQEPPPASGFSGYVEIIGAYISTDSQLNTDSDNRKTDSLNDSGKRVGKFRPLPLGLIRYTFAEHTTQLFLGVQPENAAQGQFQLEAGARILFENGTGLSASILPMTPFAQETWKDPFVVGENRKRTDVNQFGANLAAENTLGSRLTLKYGWSRQTIDDEKSGEFLSSQPGSSLTAADLDHLRRDADFHRIAVEYAMQITSKMWVTPILKYTHCDAKGSANSFDGLTPQLSFLYLDRQFRATVSASAAVDWYADNQPVFDKTRRDFKPGLFAILGYKKPFGLENFRIDWFNAFSKTTSNINFYESFNVITALGVGYHF